MAQEQPLFTPITDVLNLFSDEDASRVAALDSRAEVPPAEPLTLEICLSPLLWSEMLGVFLDG